MSDLIADKLTSGDAGMLHAARDGRLKHGPASNGGSTVMIFGLPADGRGRTSRVVTHKAMKLVERGLLRFGAERRMQPTQLGNSSLDAWQIDLHARVLRDRKKAKL